MKKEKFKKIKYKHIQGNKELGEFIEEESAEDEEKRK